MDLVAMRRTLDGLVPTQVKVSRKRWANLRSDLAAAIAASGLRFVPLRSCPKSRKGAWPSLPLP
jgi:hypothetical protein